MVQGRGFSGNPSDTTSAGRPSAFEPSPQPAPESSQPPHLWSHRPSAQVITGAEPSYDEQFRRRRRRYVIMMAMRVPFLIAAAMTYHTPWLAILLVFASVPLPWMAVLIANDRPVRRHVLAPPGALSNERALPPPQREVVDGQTASDDGFGH